MKILVIVPFNIFPIYSGANVRIYNIVEQLSKRHRITLLCNSYSSFTSTTEPMLGDIKVITAGPRIKIAQIFNPFLLFRAIKLCHKESFDLILGEYLWSGIYLIILRLIFGIPYFFDDHNVEAQLVKFSHGILGRLSAPLVRIYETWISRKASKVLCVSEGDKKELISFRIPEKKIIVVPNGASKISKLVTKNSARKQLGISKAEKMVLFFGKLDYNPNREAINVIHNKLMPKILSMDNRVRFWVIGPGSCHTSKKNLVFKGAVPDIKLYIKAADVIIVPLLHGSGSRIKILEAIACGKTVISTRIGAAGLKKNLFGRKLIIKNGWDEFADAIIQSLDNKDSFPPPNFFRYYSWENIVKIIEQGFNH